jgi:hypothetical protein
MSTVNELEGFLRARFALSRADLARLRPEQRVEALQQFHRSRSKVAEFTKNSAVEMVVSLSGRDPEKINVELTMDEALKVEKKVVSATVTSRYKDFCDWVNKNHLLLFLCTSMFIGLVFPIPGAAINDIKVDDWKVFQSIHVVTIFIISGLGLNTSQLKMAFKNYSGFLLGAVSILVLTPCAAFVFSSLSLDLGYKNGLAVFALVMGQSWLSSLLTIVHQG